MMGERVVELEEPKLWRAGEWLFGFSGSTGQLQTFQRIPLPEVEPHLVSERQVLEGWVQSAASYHFRGRDGDDTPWEFLAARGTRLWTGGGSGNVHEKSRRDFWAIGDGAAYALGAMATFPTSTSVPVPALSIASEGLRVACLLTHTCALPGHLYTTSGDEFEIDAKGRLRSVVQAVLPTAPRQQAPA